MDEHLQEIHFYLGMYSYLQKFSISRVDCNRNLLYLTLLTLHPTLLYYWASVPGLATIVVGFITVI